MRTLGICGLGGSGKEFLDLAGRVNNGRWHEIVFIDKAENITDQIFRGCSVYSFEDTVDKYSPDDIEYIISVGDVYLREKIFRQITGAGYRMTTIVAPGVYIPDTTTLGTGCIVRDNCFVSVDTVIGDNVMIQPNSVIGHDVSIGEHSVISAHCSISGGVHIGRDTYIALNCGVKELVSIGSDSIISMGSIVNKSFEDGVIVRY